MGIESSISSSSSSRRRRTGELCENGAERLLDYDNLDEYLGLLASAWLGDGIALQLRAFRSALSMVVPLQRLQLFSTVELLELVCGGRVRWTEADLHKCVVPGEGYTRDSPTFQLLLDELASYMMEERGDDRASAFLLFVTARPTLGPGGLSA